MAGEEQLPARPLALTMGDPAGISLEITLMAWLRRVASSLPPFVLFADPDALAARARLTSLEVPIEIVQDLGTAAHVFADQLPVLPVRLNVSAQAGLPQTANAGPVIKSIEKATEAVINGEASAIVTNPIAKAVLAEGGFDHRGHTEFLAHLAAVHGLHGLTHPVMMLVSEELRVVPLTVHLPLAAVPAAVTQVAIENTVQTTATALRDDFGIPHPRIAVAGLNPHAGEGGLLGREEEEVIAPAVETLRSRGLSVTGPHAADTLFHREARKRYDAVLAMYHDQALIPLKTLAFDTGVNVTLGLPFVRTSPDHGTAFDIAGKGCANPASLIESLKLAAALARRRAGVRIGAGP